MSARARLIDAATLVVAEERRQRGCTHVRRCGCVGKWRVTALVVVTALLDAGWTITPPGPNSEAVRSEVPGSAKTPQKLHGKEASTP